MSHWRWIFLAIHISHFTTWYFMSTRYERDCTRVQLKVSQYYVFLLPWRVNIYIHIGSSVRREIHWTFSFSPLFFGWFEINVWREWTSSTLDPGPRHLQCRPTYFIRERGEQRAFFNTWHVLPSRYIRLSWTLMKFLGSKKATTAAFVCRSMPTA